jgi:hypothetical protein
VSRTRSAVSGMRRLWQSSVAASVPLGRGPTVPGPASRNPVPSGSPSAGRHDHGVHRIPEVLLAPAGDQGLIGVDPVGRRRGDHPDRAARSSSWRRVSVGEQGEPGARVISPRTRREATVVRLPCIRCRHRGQAVRRHGFVSPWCSLRTLCEFLGTAWKSPSEEPKGSSPVTTSRALRAGIEQSDTVSMFTVGSVWTKFSPITSGSGRISAPRVPRRSRETTGEGRRGRGTGTATSPSGSTVLGNHQFGDAARAVASEPPPAWPGRSRPRGWAAKVSRILWTSLYGR